MTPPPPHIFLVWPYLLQPWQRTFSQSGDPSAFFGRGGYGELEAYLVDCCCGSGVSVLAAGGGAGVA